MHRKMQREMYCGMVDLSSAFDWCKRDWVFKSMRKIVGPSKLIDMLEIKYQKTICWLKGDKFNSFESNCGVRQGGVESPIGYNCLAEMAMKSFESRCKSENLDEFILYYKIPSSASTTKN